MNWDAVGAIAELIGAAAVVATLYYLAVQLRETRLQDRADHTTQAVDRWLKAQVNMLETQSSVALVRKALNRYEDLSLDERGLFTGYMFELNAAYQAVLHLSERGLLDSRQFDAIRDAMAAHMVCPGTQIWWREVSGPMPQHIKDNLAEISESYSGPPFSELLSFYNEQGSTE